MNPRGSHGGHGLDGLDRFFDDLRRTGTEIAGPVRDDPEDPDDEYGPVEWLVTAHRGQPVDPPYRLVLDDHEFRRAVEHDAQVIRSWWPGGESRMRAYEALLLSFDAALVGIDRTPHGFLREEDGRGRLTTNHLCPDPMAHLDLDSADITYSADYGLYAYEPGTPEFEAERAERARRSRHRRHAYLVLGWLEVEAATEDGRRMDAAVGYLQDQMGEAFGHHVFQRFSDYLEESGFPSTAELVDAMHEQDERFDAFLDALAGERRDG
jgi:hypothetical protein